MATACVNNVVVSPESSFIDLTPASPAYGWLSPSISFGRDTTGDAATLDLVKPDSCVRADPEPSDVDLHDFEFRLDDPIAMLPADELFSDGKLVPLHLAAVHPRLEPAVHVFERAEAAGKSHRMAKILSADACARSPGAPKCSSRWRELLGLRKLENSGPESQKLESSSCATNPNVSVRSIRQYLLRRHHQKLPTGDRSVTLPLLADSDVESVCISSRRSLSSSSSSSSSMTDHDDLPRFSLDVEKPSKVIPISLSRPPPRGRSARTIATSDGHHTETLNRYPGHPPVEAATPLTVSADSPRMSACGKVVFQGLGRSSSSPGSFVGNYRAKYRPMERSYSAGVRVAPVLNVGVPLRSLRGGSSSSSSKASPAGSVFGFGQIFSSQKKAGGGQDQIKIKPGRS